MVSWQLGLSPCIIFSWRELPRPRIWLIDVGAQSPRPLGSAGDISDKPSQLQSSLRTWLNPSLPHFPLSRAASRTPLQVPFLRVLLSSLPSLTVLFLGNLSQRLSIHPLGLRSLFTTPHGTFPASRKTVLSLVSLTNALHLHRTLSSLRAGSSPDIQL